MAALPPNDRASLRQFVQERFNLAELKNVCFDLGTDYESLPHATKGELARELIALFERQAKLGCLVAELARVRPDRWLGELLATLPGCQPNQKVQVILSAEQLRDRPNLRQQLAALLGVPAGDVALIGVASGSVLLLLGLPAPAAAQLLSAMPTQIADYDVLNITAFAELAPEDQERWRAYVVGPTPVAPIVSGGVTWLKLLVRMALALLVLAGVTAAAIALFAAVATPRLRVINHCADPIDLTYDAGVIGEVGIDIPNDGEPVRYWVPPGDYVLLLDEESITVTTPLLTIGPYPVEGDIDARFNDMLIRPNDQPVAVRVGLGSNQTIVLCPGS